MSEITATDKRQRKKRQPEKWATENWATGKLGNKNGPVGKEGNTCNCPKETATGKLRAWRKVTAVYRRAYDSRHLQADCQKPGSASEPYARQSSMGYLYLFSDYAHLPITSQTCSPAKGRFVMVTPSSLMVGHTANVWYLRRQTYSMLVLAVCDLTHYCSAPTGLHDPVLPS